MNIWYNMSMFAKDIVTNFFTASLPGIEEAALVREPEGLLPRDWWLECIVEYW